MFEKLTQSNLKVLNLFLDNPNRDFYLRELARILKISTSTSKLTLNLLKNLDLLKAERKAHLIFYKLNLNNQITRELKKIKNIELIKKNNLVEKLLKWNQNIISILLYGSFAKGTNDDKFKSDVDILIIANKRTERFEMNNIKGYELRINEFTPLEWKEIYKKNKPFYNEVITNAIILYGELPIQ